MRDIMNNAIIKVLEAYKAIEQVRDEVINGGHLAQQIVLPGGRIDGELVKDAGTLQRWCSVLAAVSENASSQLQEALGEAGRRFDEINQNQNQ